METLGVSRAGAKQLHAIIETGDYRGGMCFGDGIQFTTGCTFGKGNIEKTGEGKFAVTLVDKAAKKAVRVAYKPTLQPRIKTTPFMQKRAAGVLRRTARVPTTRTQWSEHVSIAPVFSGPAAASA
jgi:formylmethanofuran dehydrogenase subunit E